MARPRKKRKSRTIWFVLEIIVMLLFIGGLFLYSQIKSRLDVMKPPVVNEEKILVNPEVEKAVETALESEQPAVYTGYTTYALFGIDHRDKNAALGAENSDTMIIASINNDTKEVKLVSVFRDTLLNLGDGTFSKANAAYAYGGPEQAITMLNTNLDLNITEYATVDFDALVTIIDLLGGVEVPMSYAELVHMNNYCVETSADTGKSYTPIQLPPQPEDQEAILGVYKLNGVQATSYCRIRYTASLDMGRTERQRLVIQLIIDKVKKAGLSTMLSIADEVFPMVKTSLGLGDILKLAPTLFGYDLSATCGFPISYKFSNVRGSIIVPTDLITNVEMLHEFLYGADYVYTPSATVTANSQKILDIVGGAEQLQDEQIISPETENTDDDFIMWEENEDGSWEDTTPEYVDPGVTDPGVSDPGVTDPGVTDPGVTDPGVTDPGVTDPGVTDPGVTDPGVTDPGVSEPVIPQEPEVPQEPVTPPEEIPQEPVAPDPGTGGGDSGGSDMPVIDEMPVVEEAAITEEITE